MTVSQNDRMKRRLISLAVLVLSTYCDRHDLQSNVKSGAHFKVFDVCNLKETVQYARQILSLWCGKN